MRFSELVVPPDRIGLVTLDGKPMRAFKDADNEEGWVEVIDLSDTSTGSITITSEIKTKRIYGDVVFLTARRKPKSVVTKKQLEKRKTK